MLLALAAAVLATTAWQAALACACCTSTGERTDLVMKLSESYAAELELLRFDKTAELFLGEAEPDTVKGITAPADKYDIEASWKNGFLFSFRDKTGRAGTLSLARPGTISIFHVDQRSPDEGREPGLYKEWRLRAKATGTGVFTPGLGTGQTLTLVLQGRGNNCTSADQFTHWMLIMRGPKAKYHFFGSLQTAR